MVNKIIGLALLSFSVISGAAAFAEQPVYIIAHRCNDPQDANAVVAAQGVNAIEADFSYGSPTEFVDDRWAVDHDGVIAGSTPLDAWIAGTAQAINAPGSPLALIIVDIKDPDGPLVELY